MPLITRFSRAYTIALLVLAFILLAGIGDLVFLHRSGIAAPSQKPLYGLIAFLEGLYVVAIFATLALRAWAPAVGRVATVALNVLLLLAVPFGTIVGIYGLWRVDREPAAA